MTIIEKLREATSEKEKKELVDLWIKKEFKNTKLHRLSGVKTKNMKSEHYRVRECYFCETKTKHIYKEGKYRCTKHDFRA